MGIDHATVGLGAVTVAVATWLPQVATEANVAAVCGVLMATIGLATRIVTIMWDRWDLQDQLDEAQRENRALRDTLRQERDKLLRDFGQAVDAGLPHTNPARRIIEIERQIGPE